MTGPDSTMLMLRSNWGSSAPVAVWSLWAATYSSSWWRCLDIQGVSGPTVLPSGPEDDDAGELLVDDPSGGKCGIGGGCGKHLNARSRSPARVAVPGPDVDEVLLGEAFGAGAVCVGAELEPGAALVDRTCRGPVDETAPRHDRFAAVQRRPAGQPAVDRLFRGFDQAEAVGHGGDPQVQVVEWLAVAELHASP